MRRTVQIAGGLEYLFGTLDENLKLLESALHISTYLQETSPLHRGRGRPVERAVRIMTEYNNSSAKAAA